MSLTTLPTELIYQISQRVQPDDIERYGLANRRIKHIATPFLQEHRQLRSQYTKISLNSAAAAKFFYEMCARPYIRFYVRSLEIKSNKDWRRLGNSGRKHSLESEEIVLRRSVVGVEDAIHLLQISRLIPREEMSLWLEKIEQVDEDYLFAVMLACLPNVKKLIVRLDHTKLEQVKEMVRTIKRRPKILDEDQDLHKLVDARIIEGEGANDNCDLELFPLLASLPGIRHLYGRNLVGMYRDCYRDGWLSYPGASANITSIHLETCGMSVEGLEKVTKSIKGLRSFHYVAHRGGWGLNHVSDLLKSAHSTLEELVLSTGSGDSRFVGPLRKFTALKHLTLDSGMLFQKGRIQRAVDILPASVETATLTGNSLTRGFEEQFLADLYRPSFFYPNLRRLSVEDSWGKRDIGKDRLQFQREYRKQSSGTITFRY